MIKRFFSFLVVLALGAGSFPGWGQSMPSVRETMGRVAAWQIEHFDYSRKGNLHDRGIGSWTNATLYLGMSRWAEIEPGAEAKTWLRGIGKKSGWNVPANLVKYYGLHHADELCIGQFYLAMYERYGQRKMLRDVQKRVDAIMANPPSESMKAGVKQSWTWCDALFMAPPVYAELAKVTGEERYLEFMDVLFKRTYGHLYNTTDGLFFRDDNYFDKREANGSNVYWGRGNGWVAAGLANVLRQLPAESKYRPYYEELFKRFVPRLMELQDAEGYWHASLLDPASYPAPEISATAMIVYAAAWGVNNGLLGEEFLPAIQKGWGAIEQAVGEDGKVGWIQPIGAAPGSVTASSTAVYGVGAVLMAGSEIYEMTQINR